ncbi:amino acid adenylation domain-containing protein [Lysobacter enzymogenes]|nr:amino acid adenylation domain-containing protein [Lysobacter enzymogenes]
MPAASDEAIKRAQHERPVRANPQPVPEQRGLLAKRLQATRKPAPAAQDKIARIPRSEALPLSYAQQRLWFLDQLRPGDTTYNIPAAARLKGRLQVAAMEQALSEIVRRHEILRTTFPSAGGEPRQAIGPAQPVRLPVQSLLHLPEHEREAEALRLAAAETARPFDLAGGPLLRLALIRIGEADHVLLLTMHHIIADAWSFGILLQELQELYCAQCEGRPATLAEEQIQYADYAVWQRQPFHQQLAARQLDYWKRRLADLPPLLELPTDRPRPAVQTFAGAAVEFELPLPLAQAIQALRLREGATLFMVLLAAFVAVLHRYTGQRDIAVGTDIANRNWSQTEGLIGFFVNQLTLRTDAGGDPSFAELLARIKDQTLDAYAHQDLPFEQLVAALQPQRSLSYAPLFQVKLVVQNAPAEAVRLTELSMRPMPVHNGTVGFDLILTVDESAGPLHGSLEYNTDLFDRATIERLLGHWRALLQAATADSSRPISRLPMVSAAERRRLQLEFNRSAAQMPDPLPCIHQSFEQHAATEPERIAVVSGGQRLSYGELNARANRFAHYLSGLGVGPEVIVGLCLERSIEMVVAVLGVLKAGGAYLPLDPKYPRERLAYMLEDSAVPILVAQQHLLEQLPSTWSQVVCLEEAADDIARQSAANPSIDLVPENLAYVIYTSGSTGKPKGVAVEHYGIANLVRWQARQFELSRDSRISQFASYSFDAAVGETCMALLNGATLVMLEREDLDADSLVEAINRHRITVMVLVPSMLKALDADALEHPEALTIVAVGEACPPELATAWSRRCRFANAYGPTEYTVYSHLWNVSPEAVAERAGAVPIGFPISNTRTYILDADLNPVPVGVTGEIYICGQGVARGYLNKPGATATKFVPNPFLIHDAFEEHEPADTRIGEAELREFERAARAGQRGAARPGPDDWPRRLSPERIFRLIDSLSPDLIKKTHSFITLHDESSAAYGAFSRYLLEGVNQSYASCGIDAAVLRRLLPLPNFDGARGVDFGFGNGEILKTLRDMGARMTGLDFNPVFVQKARDAALDAQMVKVDLTPEEFAASSGIAPGSLDFAISTLLLDRLAHPRNMLANFFASLKRGGRFAIQTLLPVVGVDDGDVQDPLTYTPQHECIVPGRDAQEDKLALVRLLVGFGAHAIEVHALPYAVMSRDGLQEYVVWSFTGLKDDAAARGVGAGRYDVMYRTGDLGRFLPGGEIAFRGRIDNQVKIRGYRIELGDVEAAISAHPQVADCAVLALDNAQGAKQLVAYVVAANERPGVVEALAEFLRQKLPGHMVPTAFVPLPRLPLLSNGKIAYDKLPAPGADTLARREFAPPRTPLERSLARAWGKVLNLEQVGIHDNIFELGGDSILILQILAELNQDGIRLRAGHFFEHQTIARLAEADIATSAHSADQATVSGEVRPSPIQRWFFEQELADPAHYNQSITLQARAPLDPCALEESLRHLLAHHDALRLRLRRGENGWEPFNAESADHRVFDRIELAPGEDATLALERGALELQAGMDLEAGVLLKARLFSFGGREPERLMIVVHHLAVDGVSWRILLEDLHSVYAQRLAGRAPALPAKTVSWRDWAQRLDEWAGTASFDEDAAYWREYASERESLGAAAGPPPDIANAADPAAAARPDNSEAAAEWVGASLSAQDTAALLEHASRRWRASVNEVLLAAFAYAAGAGQSAIVFDVEGHGREDLFDGADVSRTVGWFTSLYPLRLSPGRADAPGEAIAAAKCSLRGVPRRGVSYGLLRYGGADAALREALAAARPARISFNYLGQFDAVLKDSSLFERALDAAAPDRSPRQQRAYWLELTAFSAAGQLQLNVRYGRNLHRRETAQAVLQRALDFLRAAIAHTGAAVAASAADFPLAERTLARLEPATLAKLFESAPSIEDLHPLTPLQQGLLFHSLAAPDTGVYVNQMSCELGGELDIAAFRTAWLEVVRRHEIFRTFYLWGEVAEPLAAVRREPELPFAVEDWRGMAAQEQDCRLASLLEADRLRGFDLGKAPLMRLTLVRTGDASQRFVWSFHHLLLDGWSVYLVLQEVFLAYEAARNGQPAALPPVRPYAAYIEWLGKQDNARAEAFWRRSLAGAAPVPFPTLGPAPADPAAPQGFGEHQALLSPALTATLQELARQQRLTLNTIVQGAWALLHGRYTDSDEAIFGAVVSGRPAALAGIQQTVGLFINTLPVRVRLSREASTLDWLQALQAQQAEMGEYEYSPLMQVRGWAGVSGRTPLFDVILAFENYPISSSLTAGSPGLRIGEVRAVEQTNYPLTLLVAPGESLSIRAVYDRRRFGEAAIERLLAHFQNLLAAIAQIPHAPPRALPMLSAQERCALIEDGNDTAAPTPAHTIPELFGLQAQRTPERTAVVSGGQRRSYRELDENANRLARYLQRQGIGRGALVGVALTRSVRTVEALLAVMKAGAAYVPLDPAYPRARLQSMIEDSAMEFLIGDAQSQWAQDAGALRRVIRLEDEQAAIAQEDPSAPASAIGADDAAYVIYTSGSTGKPKGVVGLHGGAVNRFEWMWRAYPFAADEMCCHKTALSFVDSIWEIFGPLLQGVGVAVIAPDAVADPALLVERLAESGVTRIVLVPSLLRMLLDAPGDLGARLPRLRLWVSSGEALPPDLVERFGRALPQARLLNLYGSSEVAADVTCCEAGAGAPGSIGRPIANTRIHLLDRDLNPVPPGVPAELYVGGASLARGYLGAPAATAAKFVPDPYSDAPGARLFRTGDLARRIVDGAVEYLGRADHQVKIRGFRIELGDVEAALRQHPLVREAAVVAREDAPGERRLVGYYACGEAGGELAPGDLRDFLKQRLQDYLLPAVLVPLERLPLTPSGKIDRLALPVPDPGRTQARTAATAPRTGLERDIAQIWGEVLGLPAVGVDDNFFELGGQSLSIVRVQGLLKERLGIGLSVAELFKYPTIAALAASRADATEASAAYQQSMERGKRRQVRRGRPGRDAP